MAIKLYFRDEHKKTRVVESGEPVDLREQTMLKRMVEEETNIRVKSPILSCHSNPQTTEEPMLA